MDKAVKLAPLRPSGAMTKALKPYRSTKAALSGAARQGDLTVTALNDTHELHRELKSLPDGDILVHAGDFTMFSQSFIAIRDFAAWFADQPYCYKVLTIGNHEFFFEKDLARRSIFEREGIVVLIDEAIDLDWVARMGESCDATVRSSLRVSFSARSQATLGKDAPRHGYAYHTLSSARMSGSGQGYPEHLGDPELGKLCGAFVLACTSLVMCTADSASSKLMVQATSMSLCWEHRASSSTSL